MLQMRNNITKQHKFSNIAKNAKMYCYYYIMNTPLQNLTHLVSRASNFKYWLEKSIELGPSF